MSNIKLFFVLLTIIFSTIARAGDCDQAYAIGDQAQDSLDSTCLSEHFQSYDPYNPQSYYAKYFQFSLEREADVVFRVSGGGRLYLIEGTNKSASYSEYSSNGELKARLATGDYILEYAASYYGSFTLTSQFNDVGGDDCVVPIAFATPIADGWVASCTSTSRDIYDPYSPVPDEGHRAKYFTFTLNQDTDIQISVDTDIDPYIYILEGSGQFGAIQHEIATSSGVLYLTAGSYTIELTTNNRYDPGQFTITLTELESSGECRLALTLGNTVNNSWSPSCNIDSWIPGNDDPYAGQNPERAMYYTFTLNEASDVRFTLPNINDDATILNLYNSGSYGSVIATTKSVSYWQQNGSVISQSLPAGSYELEVTQHDQIAIGSFEVETQILASECSISVPTSGSSTSVDARLSSNCVTEFRGIDGMYDPYGVQEGTYYAKRFEFTLTETTALQISASGSEASYLYIAKKSDFSNQLITESYEQGYYSTTNYPSVTRELAPGSYVVEVTSHYPERSYDIEFSLSPYSSSYSTPCDLSLNLNEYKLGTLDGSCKATQKESIANPNPYSYPSYFNYYAKRITFEVEVAGTYEISSTSSSFGSHVYLFHGGDYTGELIDDFYSTSSGEVSRDFTLSAGIYTLEITSYQENTTGTFNVLVWDKESELITECQETISPAGKANYTGVLVSSCAGSQRGSSYYFKHYDFSIDEPSVTIAAEITTAEFDTYMYLLKYDNDAWVTVDLDDDGGSGYLSKIERELEPGQYRLEVTSFSSNTQQSFIMQLKVRSDTDGDGVYDDEDSFPASANESMDSDGDGLGDVVDQDDDNDGVMDLVDSDPTNSYYGRPNALFTVSGLLDAQENQTLEIVLTRQAAGSGKFHYYTYDKTAIAGKDYDPAVGVIDFSYGDYETTITIDVIEDEKAENDEYLTLVIFPESSGSSTIPQVVELSIQGETELDALGFEEPLYLVEEENHTLEIVVSRAGDTSISESYLFKSQDGTAKAMYDYFPVSGRLEFMPGEISKNINVSLIEDDEMEPSEFFTLSLINPATDERNNYQTTRIELAGETSVNEDIVYSFNTTNLDGVSRSQLQGYTLTVKRTGPLDDTASINLNIIKNTSGLIQSTPSTAYFAAGESIAYVDIDYDYDSWMSIFTKETLQFEFVSAIPEGVMADSITWVMPPKLGSYSSYFRFVFTNGTSQMTIPENQDSSLILMRPFYRASQEVSVSTSDWPNADIDNPYIDHIESTLMLDSVVNSKTYDISPNDNSEYQGDHGFNILIDDGEQGVLTVNIDDIEDYREMGTLAFSAQDMSISRGSSKVELIIQRLYGDVGEINGTLTTRDGTAVSGAHYVAHTETIGLANGESVLHKEIELIDDSTGAGYFFVDLVTQLGEGRTSTVTLQVNIVDVAPAPSAGKKKSGSKGFLGLGSYSYLDLIYLLILILPFSIVRARSNRKNTY